ncbi:TPA: recombinase family protein [Enterobacter cloacae subsp. cloacae]|nr:recombinase family protein [Enterobacter cloacae subsp. cloacae]
MLIGYVRVSTNDQNTALQRNALDCAGCEQIFEEKISGTVANRPALSDITSFWGDHLQHQRCAFW